MINFIRQPENSNCCGQACVAMLADIALDESIKVFGKRSGTSTKDVISALHKLNIPCGDKLLRTKKQPKSDVCMVVLHDEYDKKYSHWTVYSYGLYYNPSIGIGTDLNEPHLNPKDDEFYAYTDKRNIYETSFLPIYL